MSAVFPTTRRNGILPLACVVLTLAGFFVRGDDHQILGSRSVVYSTGGEKIAAIAAAIVNPETPAITDELVQKHWADLEGYYFRLIEKRWVLEGDHLKPGALLGVHPFVFLSTPYIAYGRDLFDVYSDLGYDALSLLEMQSKDMAAIVFKYPDTVHLYAETPGVPITTGIDLPPNSIQQYVFEPTWDNAFSLLKLCVESGLISDLSASDQTLALAPSNAIQSALKTESYATLQFKGGEPFAYRKLLENQLSMNPHFLGVGRTENTLQPNNPLVGVPEFVGPTATLDELPELAIIDVGRMEFFEVH